MNGFYCHVRSIVWPQRPKLTKEKQNFKVTLKYSWACMPLGRAIVFNCAIATFVFVDLISIRMVDPVQELGHKMIICQSRSVVTQNRKPGTLHGNLLFAVWLL